LTAYKAQVDATDSNGCTALFYAVTLGHCRDAEVLLKAGAQPNRRDNRGRTPAHCAAAKGMLTSLKSLQAQGADLWLANGRGDYPLHEAVQSGNRDLIVWLLKQRPDSVNSFNQDGRTLLHLAALNNQIEICKVIMDHGAFVNPIMRNARGQLLTPLDAALHRANKGCAKYLQLYGGVPAAKITDRNALQKALVRAFSESQGEKLLPPPQPHQPQEDKVTTSRPAAIPPVQSCASASIQTLEIATESKLTQSLIKEMQDTAVQMEEVSLLTKESQTSPINFCQLLEKDDLKESQTEHPGDEDRSKEVLDNVLGIETTSDLCNKNEAEPEMGKDEVDIKSENIEISDDDEVIEGKSPSQGDHIILEEEAKVRLQKAREERKKFFEEEQRKSEELLEEEREEATLADSEVTKEDAVTKLDEDYNTESGNQHPDNFALEPIEIEEEASNETGETKKCEEEEEIRSCLPHKKKEIPDDDSCEAAINKVPGLPNEEISELEKREQSKATSSSDSSASTESRRPSRRSLDEIVRERYEQDWSVQEMKSTPSKKKRYDRTEEDLAQLSQLNLKAIADQAELIASNVCTKLETELSRMATRSQEILATDIEVKSAQVQEILKTVEEVKLFVSRDMEKKTMELQQAIELAEKTHQLIAELQSRTVQQDELSPRPTRVGKVIDDRTASDIIQRARRVRQEFYLSEEKSSEQRYSYTEEEDSERDDARDGDSDDDAGDDGDDDEQDQEEDNTDSQVSDIAESQPPGEFGIHPTLYKAFENNKMNAHLFD